MIPRLVAVFGPFIIPSVLVTAGPVDAQIATEDHPPRHVHVYRDGG